MEKKLNSDEIKTVRVKTAFLTQLNGAMSRHIEAYKCGLAPPNKNLHQISGATFKTINDIREKLGYVKHKNGE